MLANSLSTLLTAAIPNHTLISADGITLTQFKTDIEQARHAIHTQQKTNTDPTVHTPKDLVLFHTDAYCFLVWLFAAWQAHYRVIVPGTADANFAAHQRQYTQTANADPDARIHSAKGAPLYIGEMPHADLHTWASQEENSHPSNPLPFETLDPNFCALVVFTSGSTGIPVQIEKKLWQLEKEIAALEKSFGKTIPLDTLYVGSTSHQHFFGLPFLLLWPICRGSPIHRFWVRNPADWHLQIPHVFITSPAFLERAVHSATTHPPLTQKTCALFCAGGPLSAEIAQKTEEHYHVYPCEIYGSSETGHIAWRNQPAMSWHLQEGIHVQLVPNNEDTVLEIRSPFLPNEQWFRTSDRAQAEGHSFKLLGRADTILKIEDKRISATAIEMSLQETGLITRSYVLDLGMGKRKQLALIAQISATGLQMLHAVGKRDFVDHLKQHLRTRIDPVGIPRRWRFIDTFPIDTLGKVSKTNLQHYFDAKPKKPFVIFHHAETQTLTLDITRDLACLEGHFNRFPIVPGVAQIQWAIEFAKENFNIQTTFAGMKQIKFQNLMLPPTIVTLTCEWHANNNLLTFKYWRAETVYSSGKIVFN